MVGPDSWAVSNISIMIVAHSSFSYLSHNMEIPQTQVFIHSLTQITAHKFPSVFNSARSKHTICFGFTPIIFTTCILDKVQVQLHCWRLAVVPPGCCWGIKWSPGSFLMVMEEPLRQPDWDRKLHSVVSWRGGGRGGSVGTGSDI